MKFPALLSLIMITAILFSSTPSYTEVPNGGQNGVFFRQFFTKQQPKEYYEFPIVESRKFTYNTKQVFLNYTMLEDFSKPNTWSINSPSEQFKDTKNNITPTTDQDLLNWKTFQKTDIDYNLIPPVDRSKTIRDSLPTILGIRSLFLHEGFVKIQIYPKEPLYIPAFDAHYIELWAFGLKINYNVYVILEDYKGMTHKIYMGTLKHYAWRRLRGEMNLAELGGVNPSLVYTRTFDTRLKVHAISFESQDINTEGFFGTWIGDLGFMYNPKVTVPDSLSSPAAKLATSFDWDADAPQIPAAADQNANAPAGE